MWDDLAGMEFAPAKISHLLRSRECRIGAINHTLQNFLTGRKIYRKAVFVLRAFNLVGEYNEVGGSYFNGNDVLDEKELIGLMYL